MSASHHAARYRCAKCRHRLHAETALCPHCGWDVDPVLAREKAQIYERKRNDHYRRAKQWAVLKIALLGLTVVVVVLLGLMALNALHFR